MKYLGDIIAGIGFVGMILGFSSYDTNPVICGAVGVIGTLLIWIGYNVDKQTCKESKDDCYIKKGCVKTLASSHHPSKRGYKISISCIVTQI